MSYLCDGALLRLTINRDWRTGQLGYGYYCGLGPDLEKAKGETTPDTRREGKESAHSCAGIVPKDDLDECCLGHDNCWARITEERLSVLVKLSLCLVTIPRHLTRPRVAVVQ